MKNNVSHLTSHIPRLSSHVLRIISAVGARPNFMKIVSIIRAINRYNRVLGVKGFGKIGFAQAILAYFTLLVNLGLSIFDTREVARNKG